MEVRESRLLLSAAVMGIFVSVSCGGADDTGSTTTPNSSSTSSNNASNNAPTGGNTSSPTKLHIGAGGDSSDGTDEEQICEQMAATISSCQGSLSCSVDIDEFMNECVADDAFSQQDADQLSRTPCSAINTALCTPSQTSPTDGSVYGACASGYQCNTVSSEIAFCSLNGAVPTDGADCAANGLEDCGDGQTCLTDSAGGSYCVDLCDSPPCPSGTACQDTGDEDGDLICLGDGGALPADAFPCDDSGNCPVDYWCFDVNMPDGSDANMCLKFCEGQ